MKMIILCIYWPTNVNYNFVSSHNFDQLHFIYFIFVVLVIIDEKLMKKFCLGPWKLGFIRSLELNAKFLQQIYLFSLLDSFLI